jgi:hypothetical protein
MFTLVALGKNHIAVKLFKKFTVNKSPISDETDDLAVMNPLVQSPDPQNPATRILVSTRVKGCFICIYLYNNRVERSVEFGPTLAKRMEGFIADCTSNGTVTMRKSGAVRVMLETIKLGVTERFTSTIARETEQMIRTLVKASTVEKLQGEVIQHRSVLTAPASEMPEAPVILEAEVVEKANKSSSIIARYTGLIADFGVDSTGSKPVYFVDLKYFDGSIHRIKGWSLKYALEKSKAEKNDNVELCKTKNGEKTNWNVHFRLA